MSFICNTTKWAAPNQNTQVCPKNPYRIYELEDIRAGLRDSIDPMLQAQMGICGDNVDILPASPATGALVKYYAIQAIEASQIEIASTKDKGVLMANWAGKPIPAGLTIYGEFTEIKITSGFVRVYEHPFN